MKRTRLTRSSSLSRSTGVKRTAWIKRGTKPIPKVNAERLAQRGKRYSVLLAKARRGPGYAAAMLRAGGRCEQTTAVTDGYERCPETEGLHCHHLSYRRFGGNELPEDFKVLCRRCHAWIEDTEHSTRRNGRRHA